MKSKLKLGFIGVILIVIGVVGSIVIQAPQDDQVIQEIQATQDDQVIQEIQVIQDNQELTTNEKHYAIEAITEEEVIDEPNEEVNLVLTEEFWEERNKVLEQRLGNSFAAKKQSIDSSFTCDNYNELAYQYRGQAFAGFTINGSYDGTFEGYIYWKAFNECIDPNYSENYDKVFQELEKVNEQ